MDINIIRNLYNSFQIKWSAHCLERMQERDIITAYYPNTLKFMEDLKTRRER